MNGKHISLYKILDDYFEKHIIGTEIMIIVLAVSLQVDGGWLSIETSLTSLLISFAWQS